MSSVAEIASGQVDGSGCGMMELYKVADDGSEVGGSGAAASATAATLHWWGRRIIEVRPKLVRVNLTDLKSIKSSR